MSSTWEDPKEAEWPDEAPGPTDVPTEDPEPQTAEEQGHPAEPGRSA
ncbi:MAG TPA: hypothetical protein VGL60_02010 [Acidimicrobiales bacterium]|jgi:hypothetical protein